MEAERSFDSARDPHRRFDPLTGEWVIVSPQRTQRPWQGRIAERSHATAVWHDPSCSLCPGNGRAGGVRNPDYTSTFVFENDFAALLAGSPAPDPSTDELFRTAPATGECRVLCFSPRHDLTLADMEHRQVVAVIDLWRAQLGELLERNEYVQIFETRGAVSGASNAHPHGQVWASTFLPDVARREQEQQQRYRASHGSTMLVDYATRELGLDERVVVANDHWVVAVPYWAYWPYETLVLPRRPVTSLLELSADECDALAHIVPTMLRAFDRLFEVPFPYCSGWHTAPRHADASWQLHGHYYPPLLRSADVAKIPASYELLANLQRDLTAESAARALRALI